MAPCRTNHGDHTRKELDPWRDLLGTESLLTNDRKCCFVVLGLAPCHIGKNHRSLWYIVYRYYRRYSGIISNRRCFLGVRPNAFQIEDIGGCKSSSNDQKSKNNPLNIGMIIGISSIWRSFVPLPFLLFFAGKLFKINGTLTPGPGWPPEEESAKVPPEVGPGRRYFGALAFGGGVGEKLFKNHGFFSFFDWGMVIQTTFQIEDNL